MPTRGLSTLLRRLLARVPTVPASRFAILLRCAPPPCTSKAWPALNKGEKWKKKRNNRDSKNLSSNLVPFHPQRIIAIEFQPTNRIRNGLVCITNAAMRSWKNSNARRKRRNERKRRSAAFILAKCLQQLTSHPANSMNHCVTSVQCARVVWKKFARKRPKKTMDTTSSGPDPFRKQPTSHLQCRFGTFISWRNCKHATARTRTKHPSLSSMLGLYRIQRTIHNQSRLRRQRKNRIRRQRSLRSACPRH
mmetsp:Transcript_7423/g.15134  ORF Transcript_7423/g.15134 Transcript_7423/m.15134 type:complete len:249 (+) Transcript_7423:1382-2128(+)